MNTFQFFNENFGCFLVKQTNVPHMNASEALSKTHPLQKGGQNRIVSGWAIIRPSGTVMQQKLDIDPKYPITFDDRNRYEAIGDELAHWDGSPRIFLEFDKKPIPIANVFMTVDLRSVRICSPKGAANFDYTRALDQTSHPFHKSIERSRKKHAA